MIPALALAVALALPTQEIARIPVTRPCTVIVERTEAGGVRVILEFPPATPSPDPAPTPPADTMGDRLDKALAPLNPAQRQSVLGMLSAHLQAAMMAGPGVFATSRDVSAYLAARIVFDFRDRGEVLTNAALAAARSIEAVDDPERGIPGLLDLVNDRLKRGGQP